MNLSSTDYKESLVDDSSTSSSTTRELHQRSRTNQQIKVLVTILCLMIACGYTPAWLFFSKCLQTYLYYQMSEYTASPRVELCLYFAMLAVYGLFSPIAANLILWARIKPILCLGCLCILTGSISFIVCTNVWTFIAMQSSFTSIATSIFHLASLLLAWEWFSPKKRGLISGVVQAFHQVSVAFTIGLQIFMIEYKNLAPIEDLDLVDSNVDIYPQKIAMKMILLYFIMCGVQGIVTAIVLAFAQRNEV